METVHDVKKKKKKKLYRRMTETGCASVNPPPFFRNRISATRVHTHTHTCAYLPIYVFTRCSLYPFTFSITPRILSLYVAGPREMWGTGER